MDLLDKDRLRSYFKKIKPNIVIHCAGITNMEECGKYPEIAYKQNVEVTENIARACFNKTKLIYISTDQVYGEADDHSEVNINLLPINQYGKTKLQAEQKVKELCTDYIIIRTNIFGWNVKQERISSAEWIYYSLRNSDQITLFTDYKFSPIYSGYFSEIIMELIHLSFKGIINVGSLKVCSKYEFGINIAKEFGFDTSLINKGSIKNHIFKAQRFNNLELNIKKIIDIGISVPNYNDSIKKFVDDRKEFRDV